MVSVMIGSLADRYLNIAHKVVDRLQAKGHNVEYAFFFIRCGEGDNWTDGDWWLRLAVEGLEHNQKGVSIVNEILHSMDVSTLDFNYELDKPNWKVDQRHVPGRIDIKVPDEG